MSGKSLGYRSLHKFRLHKVFVIPCIVPIIVAIGILGCIAVWNGQRTILRLTRKLVGEINAQVAQHPDDYTPLSHQVS